MDTHSVTDPSRDAGPSQANVLRFPFEERQMAVSFERVLAGARAHLAWLDSLKSAGGGHD